jgi:hypothetical protein
MGKACGEASRATSRVYCYTQGGESCIASVHGGAMGRAPHVAIERWRHSVQAERRGRWGGGSCHGDASRSGRLPRLEVPGRRGLGDIVVVGSLFRMVNCHLRVVQSLGLILGLLLSVGGIRVVQSVRVEGIPMPCLQGV